jgi:hypothetical protein
MTPSDLASHFRLFNYMLKSGAAEEGIESFIANVGINDVYSIIIYRLNASDHR